MYMGGPGIMFTIVPLLIVGVFAFIIISAIVNYGKNASQPVITEHCRVISKRTNVSSSTSMTTTNSMHRSSRTSTSYYATFETDAGQRLELRLSGREFGLLVEGDIGNLMYQGEWYKGFARDAVNM